MAFLHRKKDTGHWWLVDKKSKKKWIKLGSISYVQAKEVLRKYESDSTYLRLGFQLPAVDITFKELVEEYLKSIRGHKAEYTQETEKKNLDYNSKKWGALKINEVTQDKIEEFFLEKKYKSNTIHTKAKYIRNAFNFAIEKKYLQKNPMDGVKLPRLEELPPRYSNPEDIEELFKHMSGDVLKFFKILYYTGMRPAEVIRLKQKDIDVKSSRIFISKSKTGRFRALPVHPKLVKFLKIGEGINLTRRQIYLGLKRAKDETKIKGITPYSFRHTFATQVLKNTANLRAVQMLLGHSRSTMTERYAHVLNDQLKEAVETL